MNTSEALIAQVRQSRPEMVEFCSRLLQTPSVNGVHPERDAAERVAEQAERLGLQARIIGQDAARPNVIVSTDDERPTGVLFLGHLDTVPPGDEGVWQFPPYSGTVTDGRIYGRGAIDTKGGIAAALYALAALRQIPGALINRRAQLICVPDEESGATGDLGIKFLHERGLLKAAGAIYAYSGDQITLGHRGLARYRIVCHGEAIHTGSAEWQERTVGANAVTGMARLLLALEALDFPHSQHRYFEPFRTIVTPGTIIEGGISINVVPNQCSALMDIRLTPEYDLQRIESLIETCIAETAGALPRLHFTLERLNYAPAAISDETAPIVGALETAIEHIKGIRPPRVVAGPANEGYLLIERGIPTICGMGPVGANAHAVDEYVEISGLVDAAAIFALTAYHLG